jgi:hypothetical protein
MDSFSFGDAYTTQGVDNYYAQNAATYRNPHESGVNKVLRAILDVIVPRLLTLFRLLVGPALTLLAEDGTAPLRILDLAAGSGEATLSAQRFLSTHRPAVPLSITACDPYTHELYTRRTGLACGRESFRDINVNGLDGKYDIVICSFALHLVPQGELWGVLYALSTSARWLVVLAPHKKPEVGVETGWERKGKEVLVERVRGRVYWSLNYEEDGDGSDVKADSKDTED